MTRGRVLLLEDDAALRGLLLEVLALEDFAVIQCDSYEEILREAEAEQGDIIVADFWGGSQRTLDEDGRREIEALTSLRPVILLTGRSWAGETTASELGARALMRKPFDLDHLLTAIEAVLQPGS